MKARCPYCHRFLELEEVFAEENLQAIIHLLPVFGEHARLVWEYAELFGIFPISRRTARLRRILEEAAHLYRGGEFSYRKRTYRISQRGIAEALRQVAGKQFDNPLSNHNYLKAVMIPIAEREFQEKSKDEERRLKEREEALRQGVRDNEEAPAPLSPLIKRQIDAIKKGKRLE